MHRAASFEPREYAWSVKPGPEPGHMVRLVVLSDGVKRRLRRRWPGVSAAAQPLKARAAHAGPHLNGLQI
jgi:hypothetical protein